MSTLSMDSPPDVARSVAAHGLVGTLTGWPDAPLDGAAWVELRHAVTVHRLEGLLVAAVRDRALPVTPEQAEDAHAGHVGRMCSVLQLEAELVYLAAVLGDAGVDVRVLKGSAVAHLDYADPALRCFGDVDLLVRGEQFDLAVAALGAAGLERRFPQPRKGFDARFSKGTSFVSDAGLELDLHRTFVMGPYGLSLDPAELWRDATPFEVGAHPLQALDPEMRFLHACYHAALGDTVPRLVPLRDVVEMLLGGRLDVARVRRVAEAWRAQPVLARAVHTAWTVLEVADVVALSAWAARYVPDARAQRDLAVYSDPASDYADKSLAAIRALPRLRDKLAFTRALAFPDKEYLQGRARGLARVRRVVRARGGA